MSHTLKIKAPVEDYIQYFEKLTPRSIRLIEKIADSSIRFKDPFNDVRGYEDVQAVFKKMFEDMHDPKFKVLDYGIGKDKDKAYLRWVFSGYTEKKKRLEIHGMSEVSFNADGKVIEHIDHWDASEQFYAKIPVLGAIINWVKSKLSIDA